MNKYSFNPLVSVVINTHNGEKFIKQAIESVYGQTYQNWEIILYDNASSDNTQKIVSKFGSRIRYYYVENKLSLHAARNAALKKCSGELIAFLDDDDYWYHNKLAEQVLCFRDSSVGVVCSNVSVQGVVNGININKNIIVKCGCGIVFDKLLANYTVPWTSVIVRNSLIERYAITFNEKLHNAGDMLFVLEITRVSHLICVPKVLAVYRAHCGSITFNQRQFLASDLCVLYATLVSKYPEIICEHTAALNNFLFRVRKNYVLSRLLAGEAKKVRGEIFGMFRFGMIPVLFYTMSFLSSERVRRFMLKMGIY